MAGLLHSGNLEHAVKSDLGQPRFTLSARSHVGAGLEDGFHLVRLGQHTAEFVQRFDP